MTPTDDASDPAEPPEPAGDTRPADPAGQRGHDRPVTVEDLIALRDGDLDQARAQWVSARLKTDPAVAALLDELDQTDAILERIRNQPPPAELTERLHQLIADHAAGRELDAGDELDDELDDDPGHNPDDNPAAGDGDPPSGHGPGR